MSDADTWIDGGGVFADHELPAGARIRFRPTEGRPDLDLVVEVADGVLVVAGPWSCVDCRQTAANRVELRGWLSGVNHPRHTRPLDRGLAPATWG